MRVPGFLRTFMTSGQRSGRRIVAFLLLSIMAFIVANPIWECFDHLDNLRHLGPHGILVILLLVAIAGVSLLKIPRLIWLMVLSCWLDCCASEFLVRRQTVALPSSLSFPLALPLRI